MTEAKKVYLVMGWRGSGKDTLCKQFQGTSEIGWNWRILKSPDQPDLVPETVTRLAFADSLKTEVQEQFEFPDSFSIDEHKEDKMFPIIETTWKEKFSDGLPMLRQVLLTTFSALVSEYFPRITRESLMSLTVREILIAHAHHRRNVDPEYFIRKVFQTMIDEPDTSFMITDLRFNNELSSAYSYLFQRDIVTIRVFRSCAEVPPPDTPSEHEMDEVRPDYVLIPTENFETELVVATRYFPYLKDYVADTGESSLRKDKEPDVDYDVSTIFDLDGIDA